MKLETRMRSPSEPTFDGPPLRAATVRAWRSLLLVLLGLVMLLALMPHPPRGLDAGWDKMNHLLAFAALALCGSMSQPASRRLRLWLWFSLLVYGALIEVLQSFTPNRQAEWADLLADGLGIVLGAMLGEALLRAARRARAQRAEARSPRAKP